MLGVRKHESNGSQHTQFYREHWSRKHCADTSLSRGEHLMDMLRQIPGDSEAEERSRGAGINEIHDSTGTVATDLSSWMDHPHKLAVDAKGYVWRAYPDMWSMAPTNTDNSPIPQPVTYYIPEADANSITLTLDVRSASILLGALIESTRDYDPDVDMYSSRGVIQRVRDQVKKALLAWPDTLRKAEHGSD